MLAGTLVLEPWNPDLSDYWAYFFWPVVVTCGFLGFGDFEKNWPHNVWTPVVGILPAEESNLSRPAAWKWMRRLARTHPHTLTHTHALSDTQLPCLPVHVRAASHTRSLLTGTSPTRDLHYTGHNCSLLSFMVANKYPNMGWKHIYNYSECKILKIFIFIDTLSPEYWVTD